MTIANIAKILDLHSVPHCTKGGRIYADTMRIGYGTLEEVEDLTDYTRAELSAWLGY